MAEIRTLLVANRAEIASRVFRTAREMGIRTVAVYTDADAGLPYVREADLAVHVGEGPAGSSYLDVPRLVAAAATAGADAVHPGYGFLSERADAAQAFVDAGLVWVGPPPEAIRVMGDKARARQLATAHEVPVVPGYDGEAQDEATLRAEAERIGLPVLIKASAGGGGRGMRRVDAWDGFGEALASARREAEAAFGDGRLLLERYVTRPRHVEVQVVGDATGRVVALGERDCSVQRRHQKIVEEAPAPGLSEATRAALAEAAVRVAQAVSYTGAGTVEFVVGEDERFYFLEMNTRLQVEHPVTEAITGVDLVRWQLEVAEGRPLPADADRRFDPARGHAVEVRVYAEDPMRDWMPATGTLVRAAFGEGMPGLRVDAGYRAGDTVSPHYDAMLAKVIAVDVDRPTALRRLARALEAAWVPGLPTNLALLRDVVRDEAFVSGDLHTGLLAAQGLPVAPPANLEAGARVATVWSWWWRREAAPVGVGFRLAGAAWQVDRWTYLDRTVEVAWRPAGQTAVDVRVEDAEPERVEVHRVEGDRLTIVLGGVRRTVRVATPTGGAADDGDTVYVHLGDGEAMVTLEPRFPAPAAAADDPGTTLAPTPGVVRAVHVAEGDAVRKGTPLVTLEAMKMEHVLVAPLDGEVEAVRCAPGDAVSEGAVLVRVGDGSDADD